MMGFFPPPNQVWSAFFRIIDFAPRWHEDVWIVFPSLFIAIAFNVGLVTKFYATVIVMLSCLSALLFIDVQSFLFVSESIHLLIWLPLFTLVWACARMLMFCLSFF